MKRFEKWMDVNFARGQFMRPKGQQRVSAMHEQLVFAVSASQIHPKCVQGTFLGRFWWELAGATAKGRISSRGRLQGLLAPQPPEGVGRELPNAAFGREQSQEADRARP